MWSRRPVHSQQLGYRATTFLPTLPAISLVIGVMLTLMTGRRINFRLSRDCRSDSYALFTTTAFISGLLRFARLLIDSRHKEVKSHASQEGESGENRGRENCSSVTCKESFEGGAQKPDLSN